MANNISDDLPRGVDSFLQDIAQMHGGVDYGDIIKFGKLAIPSDIKEVRKLTSQIEDEGGENEDTINKLVSFIHKVNKRTKI